MPTLRSQRSKPSKRRGEDEEMPPPPPVVETLPRTRSTRSKKVTKQSDVEVMPPEEPKAVSPARSTRSTRSKAKPKAKPKPVVEAEILLDSPSPPSTKSTRSTKQKGGKSKAASSSTASTTVKKGRKPVERLTDPELDPTVVISPLVMEAKERRPVRTAAKKGKATAKKENKRPAQVLSSLSEDENTDEDIEMEQVSKLTLEDIHRQHVIPLKSALDVAVCDMFPKLMNKLNDPVRQEKSDRGFNELMSLTELSEMPPPVGPAPKAKTKGKTRQKRARSPEKPPTKPTTVPESFAFGDNSEEQAPAKKKMIMDQPTPEKQNLSKPSELDAGTVSDDPEKSKKKDTAGKKHPPKPSELDAGIVSDDPEKSKKKDTAGKKHPPKPSELDAGTVSDDPEKSKKKDIAGKKHPPKPSELDTGTVSDDLAKSKKKDITVKKHPTKPSDLNAGTVLDDPAKSKKKVITGEKHPPKPSELDTGTVSEDPEKSKKGEVAVKKNASLGDVLEESFFDRSHSVSPSQLDQLDNNTPSNPPPLDLDSTYVLPSILAKKVPTSSAMNVTVCLKKASDPDVDKKSQDIIGKKHSPKPSELDAETVTDDPEKSKKNDITGEKHPPKPSELDTGTVSEDPEKSKKGEVAVKKNASLGDVLEESFFDRTHSVSPSQLDKLDNNNPSNPPPLDLDSTYVLPSVLAKKVPTSSAMHVTVCLKKASDPDEDKMRKPDLLKPIVPPPSFLQPIAGSRFDSPASRTFCKEPPSLDVVVEEDEQQRKDSLKAAMEKQKNSEKFRPQPNPKPVFKEKDKKKECSTSSSSSNSSMKSASSQPCLFTKKLPASATKNLPAYGSTGKLHDFSKQKQADLEEAEKRRQEHLQQKVENSKKKNAEWAKKAELKKLEDEKKLKDKHKVPPTNTGAVPGLIKKLTPLGVGKAEPPVGFVKPKFVLGPSTTKMTGAGTTNVTPQVPSNSYKPPPPTSDSALDDSFKSAHNASSFLDHTAGEGHLSSYDITMYEDLDEDLKHRENKSLPKWASDKESLKAALFSMVLLPEYKFPENVGFPKPDRNYKLFPNSLGRRY